MLIRIRTVGRVCSRRYWSVLVLAAITSTLVDCVPVRGRAPSPTDSSPPTEPVGDLIKVEGDPPPISVVSTASRCVAVSLNIAAFQRWIELPGNTAPITPFSDTSFVAVFDHVGSDGHGYYGYLRGEQLSYLQIYVADPPADYRFFGQLQAPLSESRVNVAFVPNPAGTTTACDYRSR